MHRNSRKSFSNPPSTKDESNLPLSRTATMENEAMAKVVSLCCENNITLKDIMQHRVTKECLSIFNTNGTMVKVQKSKLLEKLNFVTLHPLDTYIAIIDMGFIWRLSTPTGEDREKNDETDFTWSDYAAKMFQLINVRHKKATTIIMVNDPYHLDSSIKDSEQERRSHMQYKGGSKNIFIRAKEKLPSSRGFNDFFKNKSNKIRLQEFLRNEFNLLS